MRIRDAARRHERLRFLLLRRASLRSAIFRETRALPRATLETRAVAHILYFYDKPQPLSTFVREGDASRNDARERASLSLARSRRFTPVKVHEEPAAITAHVRFR